MAKRHKIPTPFEGSEVNNLPIRVAITVPSTDEEGEVLDSEFNKRIEETRRQLSSWFGGDTTVAAGGGWVDDEGNLIDEDVAVVEAFASTELYMDHIDDFGEYVQDKHEEWGQSQIGYMIEDRMFLYPERGWAADDRVVPEEWVKVM